MIRRGRSRCRRSSTCACSARGTFKPTRSSRNDVASTPTITMSFGAGCLPLMRKRVSTVLSSIGRSASSAYAVVPAGAAHAAAGTPSAREKKRRRRRRGCRAGCPQAGPDQGGGDQIVGWKLLRKAVRAHGVRRMVVVDDTVRVRVSCHFTRKMEKLLVGVTVRKGCVGALYIIDWKFVPRRGSGGHGIADIVVGRAGVRVPVRRTRTIEVPIREREVEHVERRCQIGTVALGI